MARRELIIAGIVFAALVGRSPQARAGDPLVEAFRRLVCGRLFYPFERALKSVDAGIALMRENRVVLETLARGNPDVYGSFLKEHYDGYLESFQRGLLELGALSKSAGGAEQAELARAKIALFRENAASAEEFDRAMDYIIGRLKERGLPSETYSTLKTEYREAFDRFRAIDPAAADFSPGEFLDLAEAVRRLRE